MLKEDFIYVQETEQIIVQHHLQEFSIQERISHYNYSSLMNAGGIGNQEQQSLHCSECGKKFTTLVGRLRHEQKCTVRSWRCQLCNSELSSKRNLINHEQFCRRKREKALEKERVQQEKEEQAKTQPTKTAAAATAETSRYTCGVCEKSFPTLKLFLRHRESHYVKDVSKFTCQVCQQQFQSHPELAKHITTHNSGSGLGSNQPDQPQVGEQEKEPQVEKHFKCRDCVEVFERWHQLLNHRRTHHDAESEQPLPWESNTNIRPPWIEISENGEETINEDFRSVFNEYRQTIVSGHDFGKVRGIYNFTMNDFNGNSEELYHQLNHIFTNESLAFRVNLAFGVILQNVETGEYRYYTPYYNSTIFDHPARINNRSDLISLFRRLERLDLIDMVMKTKESTKWQKVFITNINYFVYRSAFHIGAVNEADVLKHLRNKRSVIGFYKNLSNEPFKDHLCAFRCLTYAKTGKRDGNFENYVKGYYAEWREYITSQGHTDLPRDAKKYKGINLLNLPDFEHCFNVRITVYYLDPNDSCTRLYVSSLDTQVEGAIELNMNLYNQHFSFIKNFEAYAKKYACGFCGRTFDRIDSLKRHTKVCDSRVKFKYPGGLYIPSQTVFEEMEQTLGIMVDTEHRFYPWFAVYDFESVLKKIPQDREGQDGTRWTTEHIPVCVSIASNVPGYEAPHCIIDPDPDNLVKRLCDHLAEIQSVTAALATEWWQPVFEELSNLQREYPKVVTNVADGGGEIGNGDDTGEESDFETENDEVHDDRAQETDAAHKLHCKRVASITDKFKKYVNVLPVLGFNSSRYDLNLIKTRFPKHLQLATEADYIIKKCNEYSAIATSKFKFLDISNFLAAGCSYSKFLKAYDVAESKSYFPYEFFDDVSKLSLNHLPDYHHFMSKLRNANVLEVEYSEWVEKGGIGDPPKTGPQKYQDLLDVWQNHGMSTLEDFLEYYVNLDTGPFVQAAEKLMMYYFEMGVDVFKIAISAPGVARKLLFEHAKQANIHFASFSKDEDDLYHKIKKCAFGGPSIVFKRYAKVDETHIRNNEQIKCKSIHGYDCNSLYLYALGDSLPILFPIRRLAETNFRPQVSWKHLGQYMWMNWLMKCNGEIHIQHKLNSQREFPVGPYQLDGYSDDGNERRGYEFYGCWIHGHSPEECASRKPEDTPQDIRLVLAKRDKVTKDREHYIRSKGINLTVVYECEFTRMRKEHPEIQTVINDMLPEFYTSHPRQVSTNTILKAVESGQLTGLVQVDIKVPEVWPLGKEREMSPAEYFSEMSPIFCNAEVHFDDWGADMQDYSLSNQAGEFSDSRKLLIGGLAARKIFLATNLLKWYLEKGLEVTRVYEVVEYKFKKCFEGFCDYISEARRKGDSDPSKEILGETCKVLGNASYGSLLLDKTKHTNVKYVQDKSQAHMAVNDPLFKKLVELPDDLYEVEMSKKVIKLDIPIQLAFCILQTAKLKLLEFYFDCLDYYIDRKDFELTHADTDSLYFTLSGAELTDVIIPSKREEFERAMFGHCHEHQLKASEGFWFPRRCCATHIAYDKRERGLFKLEASGTELIALASKTYFLRRPGTKDSVKAKGINKSSLVEPMQLYSRALFEKESSSVRNVGFRARNNKILTYSQTRRGFSYFYVKRVVQQNGIDTLPLQIVLDPWENFNVVVLDGGKHCISNDYPCLLRKHGKAFTSCTQLFFYEKAMFNGCLDVAERVLASNTEFQLQRAVKAIKVENTWFRHRDNVMQEVIQLKIQNMKDRVLAELNTLRGKMIVHPGRLYPSYWTCGLTSRMAEITSPKHFPGDDNLARFWERLSVDEGLMNR